MGKGLDVGLIDKIKGLFGRSKRDEEIMQQLDAMLDDDSGPSQPYIFAHIALRQFLHDEPLKFFGILASEVSTEFLQSIWDDIAQQLSAEGADTVDFTFTKELVTTARCGPYPIAVLQMPEPSEVAEAHFIAAVLLHEGQPEEGEPINACYYTLEKGMTFGDSEPERTVFCEWTKDGSHSNYGDGPEPNVKAFIQWIAKQNKWSTERQ